MEFAAFVIFAYLLGSIPFGLIIATAHGKDLRSIGSGNIGATNVSRALGKKWAYICFTLDVAKGLVPMLLVSNYSQATQAQMPLVWLAVGCAAVLGHIFPIYIKFKGGKGVATSLGLILGLWPYYTICVPFVLLIWIVTVLIWRYVSLASIIAAITFPIVLVTAIFINNDWKVEFLWPLLVAAILVPVIITLRHRDNIKRILAGTENKILQRK